MGVDDTRLAWVLPLQGREVRMLSSAMRLLLVVLLAIGTAGCELVGDIFQAGLWVGVILVVLAIALVMWLVAKVRG
jgi:hypothetical protein